MNEVGDDAMKRWQPREVIAIMTSVDPHAQSASHISFGVEEVPGQPAVTMQSLGEDRRFTARWASNNHNALGNFLHAPTVHSIESNSEVSAAKMLDKATTIIQTLEQTLATPIFNFRFGKFLEFHCSCDRPIKRAEGSFKPEDGIVCPACSATYDPIEEPDSSGTLYRFAIRRSSFICINCQQTTFVGNHELVRGRIVSCECGARYRFAMGIEPYAPDMATTSEAGGA